MNYEKKYLKYKQKYLKLKQLQRGGDLFDEEKEELLNKLKKDKDKLLFPRSVIDSMKKQTLTICDLMENYNDCLIKIRNLYNDLNKLTKWGLINDSFINWKFSVNRNIYKLDLYYKEILQYINDDDDMFRRILKNQCELKIEKLNLFMTITKKNYKYIWFNTNKNEEREFTQQFVIDLLPRCIDLSSGEIKSEKAPVLDKSDDFSL